MATNLAAFGEIEDVNGINRKMIPLSWIRDNYLDFTPEQVASMEVSRRKENIELGFNPDGTVPEEKPEETEEEFINDEEENLDEESIEDSDNANF